MASTGSSKQVVIMIDERRNMSSDWSDPDDFIASDTVKFYCSQSAGSDSNNGTSDSTPKQTLAALRGLVQAHCIATPGRPYHALLKRGDTWTDEVLGVWTTTGATNGGAMSGRSSAQRAVIGAYGTGVRPRIKMGSLQSHLFFGSIAVSNLAILGIDFDSYLYPAGSGSDKYIEFYGPSAQVLIEDCRFRSQSGTPIKFASLTSTTAHTDVVIRRNVFGELLGQSSNWIRMGHMERLLVQQNHFNGRAAISWTSFFPEVGAGIQGDSACLSEDVIVEGNTFSNFGTHAVYLNCGGIVRNNVVFQGANGIQVGNAWEGTPPGMVARAGGVDVDVSGNYISDLLDPSSQLGNFYQGGRGIYVANCGYGGQVNDNILTRNTGTKPWALEVIGSGATGPGVPCRVIDLSVRRNKVYRWWRTPAPYHYKGLDIIGNNATGQPPDIANLDFKDNEFQEPIAHQSLIIRFADHTLAISGEIDSSRNRFWRGGPLNDRYSPSGFSSTDIAGYRTAMGDTSSVEVQVAYPDADKTLADYHASIGGTATTAALVDAMEEQSRYTTGGASGWNDDLMASRILAYMRANFAA